MSYNPPPQPPVNPGHNRPPQPPVNPGHYPPPQQYGPPAQPYPPVAPPVKPKSNGPKIVVLVASIICGFLVCGVVVSAFAGGDKPRSETAAAAPTEAAPTEAAPTEAAKAPAAEEPVVEEPAEATTFGLKPGAKMVVDDGSGVQEWTLKSAKFRTSCGGLAGPEQGGFLIVDMLVVQKSGTGSVNPLFLNFVGDDGTTANSISGAFSGCEKNNLDSTNSLRQGQKRAGQAVFDVPSAKGSIELTPGLGADTVGSWKIG